MKPNGFQTPTREQRQPFPPSTAQSPANLEQSSNSHSQSSNLQPSSVDPETNLVAQNEQLWKLIEKQRAGYSQMLKELERVRAERDYWRAKATGANATPSALSTPLRPSRQQLPVTSQHLETRKTEPSPPTPVSLPPRSESLPSPIPTSAVDEQRPQPTFKPTIEQGQSQNRRPSLQSELSNSSISSKKHLASDSVSSFGSHASRELDRGDGYRKTSLASSVTPNHANGTNNARPDFADPATPTANSQTFSSQMDQPKHDPPPQRMNPHAEYPANNRPTMAVSQVDQPRIDPPPRTTSHGEYMANNRSTMATPPNNRPPMVANTSHLSPAPSHATSRDSRISLPDEARQYIANMVESPFPSPQVGGSFNNTMQPVVGSFSRPIYPTEQHDEPPAANAGLGIEPTDNGPPLVTIIPASLNKNSRNQQESRSNDAGRLGIVTQAVPDRSRESPNSEFLDMDEESDASPAISPMETRSTHSTVESLAPSTRSSKPKARVDDFPLPPSHSPMHPVSPPAELEHKYSNSSSDLSTTPIDAPPQMAFRALPLLSTDLPYTRCRVSYSSVRPNDRGKDVLSFIIIVSPGQNKDSWKVEKLYSDVMTLDSRVRASLGKSAGKKVPSLPESKLWKDHAPAKVDQRKLALETYLQALIRLPVKNNDEVIAFFTSDILRDAQKPVSQNGYKEGYLTKRGKNFGGWKSRYFVLQGPVLEYYESRGGAHLGSIVVTGAQIGRQQPNSDKQQTQDEEKEYRHAFLIVEAKKAQNGNHPRHVLCAESDLERDSWVDMLVRYFSGTYSDDDLPVTGSDSQRTPSRTSTTTHPYDPAPRRQPARRLSRDDASIAESSTKIFQGNYDDNSRSGSPSMMESSPAKSVEPSPLEHGVPGVNFSDAQTARRILERGQPSSLPDSSPLSGSSPDQSPLEAYEGNSSNQRSNSEMGHYSDLQPSRRRQHSPETHRTREPFVERKGFQPTLNAVASSPTTASTLVDRSSSPDKLDVNSKVKISGPMGGTLIPSGFKFGGKEVSSADATTAATVNERREKAKSRGFWGFGRPNEKVAAMPFVVRAVFGIPLEDSLEVAQIANLPAIVFRSIQYLEAKKADQEEGIYRLSGSSAVIKALKDRFNTEGDIDLLASDEYWDPHAIAGLLKGFLRDLPSSILTRDLHLRFLAVIDFVDPQERIKELSRLIAALPLANYSLLRALTAHLILIVQNSNVNKMTMRNVGIVFSPTLGIPAGVFSLMLGEFNRVFNVNADGEDAGTPVQDTNSSTSSDLLAEPAQRNSQRYSDAAADKLLGLSGRALTVSVDDTQSDGDLSVEEDSDDGGVTIESPQTSPTPRTESLDAEEVVTTPKTKASSKAATRGLNIAISDKGNRHSRMMGLPNSPRPGNTYPASATSEFPTSHFPSSPDSLHPSH